MLAFVLRHHADDIRVAEQRILCVEALGGEPSAHGLPNARKLVALAGERGQRERTTRRARGCSNGL